MQGTGCADDASRFTVVASETVIGNCTGLEWQLFTADITADGLVDLMLWCKALDYCKDLVLGGHADWRLPNVRELLSVVGYGRFAPAANPVFRAAALPCWSSTTDVQFPHKALGVEFHGQGDTFHDLKNSSRIFVRAVRGGF
jgi:hypothetical protein